MKVPTIPQLKIFSLKRKKKKDLVEVNHLLGLDKFSSSNWAKIPVHSGIPVSHHGVHAVLIDVICVMTSPLLLDPHFLLLIFTIYL